MVSAGTALLLETAQNAAISNGTITNRTREIYHAETSEIIKAALMAGADRYADNLRGPDLTSYTVNSSNGLDNIYGAGQMNIFNSYHIIAGAEQDSIESGGPGQITAFGFDYNPDFSKNDSATYAFTATAGHEALTASLVWNIDIGSGDPGIYFDPTAALYDFNLALVDMTSGQTVVAESNSITENTENIWTNLELGHDYQLQVTGEGSDDFTWDYGLAWQIISNAYDIIADYNENGRLDSEDIDILFDIIHDAIPPTESRYDLNNDSLFDIEDVNELVRSIFMSEYGDTDLDRSINAQDLGLLLANYGIGNNWQTGDCNGDHLVNAQDLGTMLASWGPVTVIESTISEGSPTAIPEPASLVILLILSCSILKRNHHNI